MLRGENAGQKQDRSQKEKCQLPGQQREESMKWRLYCVKKIERKLIMKKEYEEETAILLKKKSDCKTAEDRRQSI